MLREQGVTAWASLGGHYLAILKDGCTPVTPQIISCVTTLQEKNMRLIIW